jgi:competence protein ComEA
MEEWLERYRVILIAVLIVLVLAGVTLIQTCRPKPEPIKLSTATPIPMPQSTPTSHPLRVYVSGAVQKPDVYTLATDSIVKDAVMAAGGPTDEADLDRINLAAPLSDGQHVYVPHLGEENPPVEPPSRAPATDGKININTADAMTLETLPGIGPSLAQRIIDYRQANGPFAQVEDIVNVSGIGPGILAKIKDQITTK